MTLKKMLFLKKNCLTATIKVYHPLQSKDIMVNCHNQNLDKPKWSGFGIFCVVKKM